jgi:hypothetical protein
MGPYTSKVQARKSLLHGGKKRKVVKTKKVKSSPPKGNPDSDAAKRERAAAKKKPVSRGGIRKVAAATQKAAASQAGKAAAARVAGASAARMGIFARGATKFAKSRLGVPAAVLTVGAIAVDYARKAFDESKKRRLDKDTTPDSPSVGKSTEQRKTMERLKRERTFRAKVQLLTPLKEVRVPDTRAKKTGNRPTTGKSGDGPGPKDFKAPESTAKKDSRLAFEKYNKTGSKLGMKMDDILRGAFSFMGTLPKSTDEDKWKYKK